MKENDNDGNLDTQKGMKNPINGKYKIYFYLQSSWNFCKNPQWVKAKSYQMHSLHLWSFYVTMSSEIEYMDWWPKEYLWG